MKLSIIVLTNNWSYLLLETLKNIEEISTETLISDTGKNFFKKSIKKASIVHTSSSNLGDRKKDLILKATGDWILVLDTDERLSEELRREIKEILDDPKKSSGINGYRIPYQNHVFGKPVYYGGENYSKVRLFRRGKGWVDPYPIHEEVHVEGKVADLKGKILHYSYRNPLQLITKFTKYAWTISREKKKSGEKLTLKKLLLYGPHMFWSRFMVEKGYKDSWRGFVLAKAFGYMEALTYWFMLV